jgi:hypothetical protein
VTAPGRQVEPMKTLASRSAPGCLIWLLLFGLISSCVLPAAIFVGGFSSALSDDFIARTLGPLLCPAESTAEIISYDTTSVDEFGNTVPATGYEMRCVDDAGRVVRGPSPAYAFYWIGLVALASLVVSGLLALLLAAPAGALLNRLLRRPPSVGTA